MPPRKPSVAMVAVLEKCLQSTPEEIDTFTSHDAQSTEPASVSCRKKSAKASKEATVDKPQATQEDKPASNNHRVSTCASNKNTHPGQIINNNKQKQRSPAEVKAEKIAKKADALAKLVADTAEHKASVQRIASEEDRLYDEDLACKLVTERPDLAMEDIEPDLSVSVGLGKDEVNGNLSDASGLSLPDNFYHDSEAIQDPDYMPVVDVSDTESQEDIEHAPDDSDSSSLPSEVVITRRTGTSSKHAAAVKSTNKKEHGAIRANIAAQREIAQVAGAKRKTHEKTLSASATDQESSKRTKTVAIGGLRGDWRPTFPKPRPLNTSRTKNVKTASDKSNTGLGDEQAIDNIGGEFDDEEQQDTLEAIQASKIAAAAQGANFSSQKLKDKAPMPSQMVDTKAASRHTFQAGLRVTTVGLSDVTSCNSRLATPTPITGSFPPPQAVNGHVKTESTRAITMPTVKTEAANSTISCAKAESHTFAVQDLPFPPGQGPAYSKKWRNYQASLINWSGTLHDMFSATAHPKFTTTVKTLWIEIFPELAEHVDNRAIIPLAGATLGNHRSAMGKAAVALTANLVPTSSSPAAVLKIFSGSRYSVPGFVYRDPDAMSGDRGSYLSELLMETFTVHMGVILQAEQSFGRPYGALALTCAALERAIHSWKDAVNEIEGSKKDKKLNKQNSFKGERWGPVALHWLKGIKRNMLDRRWSVLICRVCMFIPDKGSAFEERNVQQPTTEADIRDIDTSGDEGLDSE
ncbi:hypothetical protein BDN71DRAFT_1513803 [Pleurotus eryngii]|uniref:Uncharacterized protein n=1 Tax=Pleurotus eryngii TaxID=5323 RepID=A0A9P5ZJ86_PLEER|nr:hypothetical protein BDN71DRAFT_1513803 [Pleurotus eryngii]